MHSRIFQISKQPIDKIDYIEESNYHDHWFTNQIADYVDGCTDRESDIGWLKSCYNNQGLSFGADDNGEYFIVEDKNRYFEPKFERFQKTLQELSAATLEDFVSDKSGLQMYSLKEAYDDKFGFYVDSEETFLVSFDEFVRCSEAGIKYYIGATIDYHF